MSSINDWKIELVLFLLASDFGYYEDMNFEYIEDVKGYTISSHKKRVKKTRFNGLSLQIDVDSKKLFGSNKAHID